MLTMNNLKNQKAFTLIELLIVVAVIGILAAIAIPGYLGMQERSKRGAMIRAVSASETELQAWLHSVLKSGTGATLTENDTDGNGVIQSAVDMNNADLAAAGVCATYIDAQNNPPPARNLKSPWSSAVLWAAAPNAGQIACVQATPTGNITLIATDASNNIVTQTKTISTD